jgi:ATP-dependent Clp protease adaptor protein ClpS
MTVYSDNPDACLDLEELDDDPQPSRWGVLLHNDDRTPIGLVIEILHEVFDKPHNDAEALAYGIHGSSKPGLAGVYPRHVALLKSRITEDVARKQGYPLKSELIEIGYSCIFVPNVGHEYT